MSTEGTEVAEPNEGLQDYVSAPFFYVSQARYVAFITKQQTEKLQMGVALSFGFSKRRQHRNPKVNYSATI